MAARLFAAQTWVALGCGLLLLMAVALSGDETRRGWIGRRARWFSYRPGVLLALLAEFAVAPAHRGAGEPEALARRGQRACTCCSGCAPAVVLWKVARAEARNRRLQV